MASPAWSTLEPIKWAGVGVLPVGRVVVALALVEVIGFGVVALAGVVVAAAVILLDGFLVALLARNIARHCSAS